MTCDTSILHGKGVSFAQSEAELVWSEILEDAVAGELQPLYGQTSRWQQELKSPVLEPPNSSDLRRYIMPMLGVYPARGHDRGAAWNEVLRAVRHTDCPTGLAC